MKTKIMTQMPEMHICSAYSWSDYKRCKLRSTEAVRYADRVAKITHLPLWHGERSTMTGAKLIWYYPWPWRRQTNRALPLTSAYRSVTPSQYTLFICKSSKAAEVIIRGNRDKCIMRPPLCMCVSLGEMADNKRQDRTTMSLLIWGVLFTQLLPLSPSESSWAILR